MVRDSTGAKAVAEALAHAAACNATPMSAALEGAAAW